MSTLYLLVEPHGLHCFEGTLRSVLANSASARAVMVIASVSCEAEVRGIVAGMQRDVAGIGIDVFATETADHLVLAMGMAAQAGGVGAWFIKAGVTVPYAWDARLERIASHNARIGTVSPLCDVSAMFALFGEESRKQVAPGDMQYVDSLVFSLSERTCIEVPCFFEDCFYATAAALGLAGRQAGKGKTTKPSCWVVGHVLAAHGCLNVLGDYLYVQAQLADKTITHFLQTQEAVQSVIRAGSFAQLGRKVFEAWRNNVKFRNMPGLDMRPVQLHVQHNLGGGLDKWVKDYCVAEQSRINLVLKSAGWPGVYGRRLMLFSSADDAVPLKTWEFALPIYGTAVTHLEYSHAVHEILTHYCVDAILVSSLIGHSLDILNTSKQTILIAHDYHPYCAALNITFDGVCGGCETARLQQCFRENPHNRYFHNQDETEWEALRDAYLAQVREEKLNVVVPSRSVSDNLIRIDKRFSEVKFSLIPHGSIPLQDVGRKITGHGGNRLRVVVLGRLAPDKGAGILKQIMHELSFIADLYLVGCGQEGKTFEHEQGVTIISSYEREALPRILGDIGPDFALLLSVVPETYSYTLSELMELGVPVLATRLGSFADRIEDGLNGFLAEPSAGDIMEQIRMLDADRAKLHRVRSNLATAGSRGIADMVADYRKVLPLPDELPAARFQVNMHSQGNRMLAGEARQQDLFMKEQQLAQVMSSTSWRITAPLRWVIGSLRGRRRQL